MVPVTPAALRTKTRTVSSTGMSCMRRPSTTWISTMGPSRYRMMSTECVPLSIKDAAAGNHRVAIPAAAHVDARGEGVFKQDDLADQAGSNDGLGLRRRR